MVVGFDERDGRVSPVERCRVVRLPYRARLSTAGGISMARVLVIDDDESVRMAIEALLQHEDWVAVLADSGRLGAKTFETSHFDVVMIDIFMPGMDGLETIKGFRKRAPKVPIIAMSGFRFRSSSTAPAPDFLGIAAQLGATYCLQKPFGPEQLVAAIKACLGDRLPAKSAAAASPSEQRDERVQLRRAST
jgi:DNA-binding response OmpR family regulator